MKYFLIYLIITITACKSKTDSIQKRLELCINKVIIYHHEEKYIDNDMGDFNIYLLYLENLTTDTLYFDSTFSKNHITFTSSSGEELSLYPKQTREDSVFAILPNKKYNIPVIGKYNNFEIKNLFLLINDTIKTKVCKSENNNIMYVNRASVIDSMSKLYPFQIDNIYRKIK